MATYDAGDASINIRPSLKGFVTELETELKKIDAQLGVAVHPDIARAKEELAAWRAQEERNSIDIPVNVDTNSVQRATREMGKLADAGKALSALKWNAGALGLGSLPAAATVLANVAGAMQQISQAGLLLPGVMAAGAASIGTFKLGVVGVADAFEAVEKSADGTTKSIEAANKALADLAPSAADAVRTAVDVKKELTEALQKPIQQKLFEGVSGDLRKLVDADLPVLQKGLTGIASGLNQNLRQLMASAGSESSQGLLDRILGNTGDAQARLSKAIDPLIHGLGTLAAAGTDTLPRLADGVGRLAERFDKFISAADNDGRLAKWIDDGIKGVEHLGSIVLDLGKTLAGVAQAAGGGEGLLSMLDAGAEKLAVFVNSAEGQDKLRRFFEDGRRQLQQWFEILKNVGSTLGDVYNGAKQWADMLLPVLSDVTSVISAMPGGVTGLVTAFLAWKSIDGVASLLGKIGGIGSGIDGLAGKADVAAGGISRALSRIALPAGLAALGFSDMSENGVNAGNALTTIGGATVAGASIGGPWGALIGAITGLTAVLIKMNPDQFESDKDEQDWQKWRDSGGSERVETANQITGRNGVLQPSMYNQDGSMKPSVSQGMADLIAQGQLPGYSIGPNGQIITPDGIALPGATPTPAPKPPAPPPPPPRPQVPAQVVNPLPGAAVPVPKANVEAPGSLSGLLGGGDLSTVKSNVADIAKEVQQLSQGEVKIKDPSPEVLENLKKLDVQIENTGKDEITVKANTSTAQATIDAFVRKYQQQQFTLAFNATFPQGPPPQHKAAGGEIWGGVAGRDSVPLMGMPGEHMLTTDDVAAMGGQGNVYAFRRALHSGKVRAYAGGGAVVDEFGNPINPGAAPGPGGAPSNLGGPTAGADSGIIPGLQTQHGAGTIVPAGYTPSGGAAPLSLADRAAGMPGLFGLFGSLASSNPAQNLMSWGEQTGQWLGNFTARTVGSFATSLWKGALGIFGLENSILSPDNPWNLAGQSVGQFAFGSDGPLGKLLGANPGAGAAGSDSRKAMDPKKIREAQQKVADKQKAVEEQRARMADMPAKASQSTRMTRQNALDKAIREANDAQTDLTALLSGASASGSGMSGLAYPIGGTGAEQWRPTVRQVLAAYGPAYGITGSNFQSWEDALVRQINTESGGNPNSVNANDSNGRGGTQRVAGILNFLQSTFEAHNITGGDYMDPSSQIAAALPYVAKRWGVDETGAPLQIGRGQGFAFGGGVRGPGGPKGDQIPAMLSDNEHVLTSEDVDAMGGQSAVYAFRGALHRAPGGEVSLALLRNPTPPPRPTVPDIKPMTPRPPAPTPAPRPAPAPVAQQPAPAPAPQGPQPATQEPAQQQGGQSRIGGPGPGSAPSQLNHNLPWIDTAIDSTASTLGNIAATAMSMGAAGGTAGMGGGAGGALASSMVAGLFQQGGKIAKNVVNVFSSALVGNLGDNTTAGAYGAPLLSAPPQPARSIDARTVFGDVSANDPRDFVEKQRLYEQQRSQTMVDYV
ncbi:hypothetical protein [Mycolicibacterium fortuitum]|uniref:Tape measure protein n=1 Tax=Mycolicibacterium fortuitum TaxID=1766 RepID=A0AAE4VGJ6_MYCFO|nr:hypothetical protein [Mycolicibacterium fortuitum]MDV7194809.1 hypothetical protein [Mycolicibacterium fortuitum]MDV7207712.1 hypothetical protein [Mycolicibacterium fortuitum]MDV7229768.1 hypothetical protein [Mycolicibacterium fortuitum]MDV7261479.1 hypothetical protein [Mycolicibacterium fortuitum]MDV7286741.1 hypothetical protein [Mycolicibacterium fortuitum]